MYPKANGGMAASSVKIYDWKEPLPKGQEWSIKNQVPRKDKKGGSSPLTVYVAKGRAGGSEVREARAPTCPEGRAVFTRNGNGADT